LENAMLIATIAFLIAGFVKGVIGLGLPTVAIGLLGLVMPPAEAAALLVVPSLVTNVWQLAAGPSFKVLLLRLWPMLLGVCAGTWAATAMGAGMLAIGETGYAAGALGVALLIYACLGLSKMRVRVPARIESRFSFLVGATTGAVTAATGVFVIPAVPWLQAMELRRDDLIQALGLSFLTSTITMAAGLAEGGAFDTAMAGSSLLALIPALGGMALGQWVRTRVHPNTFRRCFFMGLLALGGHLALQPLF
jgi:uncharacterized membrane protein YfcA